jgi:DNA-binding NarL/FixJ family response regulator
MPSSRISVVFADDHPLIRAGLRGVLEAAEDICLLGEAVTGQAAREMAQTLQPNVLILDFSMPGPPAVETIAWLAQHCPQVRTLVLTAYDDEAYVRGVVGAGASGYVLKDETPETVLRAIRVVFAGDTWFSRRVIGQLLGTGRCNDDALIHAFLTDRDKQILRGLAQGWDNARLATELTVAEQTVRNYVSRLYAALGVKTRTEAAIWAREHGLA